jgi:hypothetical protein
MADATDAWYSFWLEGEFGPGIVVQLGDFYDGSTLRGFSSYTANIDVIWY